MIGTVGFLLLVAVATILRDRRPHERAPGGFNGERGAADDPFDVAVRLHHDGRRREAACAYERAEQSGDEDAAYNLGVLHYEAGEYDAAEAAWRRCIEREHAKAATNLGFLLQRSGDRAGARELYTNAARWGDEIATRMLAELPGPVPDATSGSAEPAPNSTGSSEHTLPRPIGHALNRERAAE